MAWWCISSRFLRMPILGTLRSSTWMVSPQHHTQHHLTLYLSGNECVDSRVKWTERRTVYLFSSCAWETAYLSPSTPSGFPCSRTKTLLHLSLFFARFHRFRRLPLSFCMTGAQCNQVQTNLSAFLHIFSSVFSVRSFRSVSLSEFAPVFKHECSLKVGFAYGLDGKQFLWQRSKEHDALCDMREFRRVLQPFCVKKYHYPF